MKQPGPPGHEKKFMSGRTILIQFIHKHIMKVTISIEDLELEGNQHEVTLHNSPSGLSCGNVISLRNETTGDVVQLACVDGKWTGHVVPKSINNPHSLIPVSSLVISDMHPVPPILPGAWEATHGCEDCGIVSDLHPGLHAVNPDCKTCGGDGIPQLPQ